MISLETSISILSASLPYVGILTDEPIMRLYSSARAYAPHVNSVFYGEKPLPLVVDYEKVVII